MKKKTTKTRQLPRGVGGGLLEDGRLKSTHQSWHFWHLADKNYLRKRSRISCGSTWMNSVTQGWVLDPNEDVFFFHDRLILALVSWWFPFSAYTKCNTGFQDRTNYTGPKAGKGVGPLAFCRQITTKSSNPVSRWSGFQMGPKCLNKMEIRKKQLPHFPDLPHIICSNKEQLLNLNTLAI